MTIPQTMDVLIIGAGPAGLSAAAVLAAQGLDVHLVDREPVAGGIPRHCGHSPYGWREFRRLMGGQTYVRKLIARVTDAGASIHTNTSVVALCPNGQVELCDQDGVKTVRAKYVLITTGARETSRAARLIGGTKPGGVMNTGALQGLVYLAKQKPFKRPVILGTELVSFSALLTCRHSSARPVAMIEPGDRITTYGGAQILPRALGVPVHLQTQIDAIHGADWVTGITVSHAGQTRDIECDGVVVTGKFRPENALLRASHLAVDTGTKGPVVDQFGRCSDPSYFAAGNVLRPVETAPWCWDEGRRVAAAILDANAGRLPDLGSAEVISTNSAALAWHFPQRVAVEPTGDRVLPAFGKLQIGLGTAFNGTISYCGDAHQVRSRPARRVLLPLPKRGAVLDVEEQM